MSRKLRADEQIFLIGSPSTQILGSKLPSVGQVLSVFFYNVRTVKLNTRESASLAVRECNIFWEKARIPVRAVQLCITKLLNVYEEWRALQKNSQKVGDSFKLKETEFINKLNNLFDIAHVNALNIMKIENDKQFLINQRLPGRIGCLVGVDKKLLEHENKAKKRKCSEIEKLTNQNYNATEIQNQFSDMSLSSPSSSSDSEFTQFTCIPMTQSEKKRGRTNFISPKLVAALDRCKLSVRDSVYIIQATAEALGINVDSLVINKSSIHRCRDALRVERSNKIKTNFQSSIPSYITVHWDGKILPTLNVRDSGIDRLPIVLTSKNQDLLIGIPKLEKSTGKEQANAIYHALENWGVTDIVQALCCDTTASNTGRLNGACVLLEQKLGRDLLYLPCRHQIYEIILRGVFETVLPHTTTSPDIALFKNFRNNWNKIDVRNITSGIDDLECGTVLEDVRNDILHFCRDMLQNKCYRDDYKELLELSITFLNGNLDNKFKIRPPGAMHQARWMSRAIYCLKIYIFRNQYFLSSSEKNAIRDICIFIVRFYLKAWFNCTAAARAPANDLYFIKCLKLYENEHSKISKAVLTKISNHLWYLTEETAALAFFDDTLSNEIKRLMVQSLNNDGIIQPTKRLIVSFQDLGETFSGILYYRF